MSRQQSKHRPPAVGFPPGTALDNVSGCFLVGFIATASGPALGNVA